MSVHSSDLQTDHIRGALRAFWDEALQVEATAQGFALALPQTLPDGWQLVVELTQRTPAGIKLTDRGRTLGWLASHGQNIEAEALQRQIEEHCQQNGMHREGWELFRWLPLPLQGVDIHVFAEALVAIAHLHYLHDSTPRVSEVADATLLRVFSDRNLAFQVNATLPGKTEREVRVDYLAQPARPVAFQLLRRRGRILPTMEQWGYRWNDLSQVHVSLMSVMLYDPAVQEIDVDSRAIGEHVCDLFCAYDETDRIHDLLSQAAR